MRTRTRDFLVWIDKFYLIMAVLDTAILVGGRSYQRPKVLTQPYPQIVIPAKAGRWIHV